MLQRLLPAVGLLLLGLGLPGPGHLPSAWAEGEKTGKPTPPANLVEVPVGIPVQLDGRMPPAEWEDATQRALAGDGTVLKIKQFRGMLLLGLDAPAPWRAGSRLWLAFTADEEGAGLYAEGAVRLDFEPLEHDRAHLMVMRHTGPVEVPVEGMAVARADVRGARTSIEVAVKLELLGITREDPRPVRFLLLWAQPRATRHPTWPEGLTTTAPSGQPSQDLASSRRWGLLSGWKDVDGGGAFPAVEWEAFVEEDREFLRRGREAHAFGMLIAEERQTKKQDDTQAPALIDNLRWIAEREPLAPSDLLLLVRGFRFLNRKAEALAVLDALAGFPAWRMGGRVAYERALTLRSAERYEEAARSWEALGKTMSGALRERYVRTAQMERERLTDWEAEQAARREDEARRDLPLVLVRTTRGNVVLLLHADDVPNAVDHFLALAETQVPVPADAQGEGRGFYDGLLFHRVIGDFLAQCGDELTRGGDCEAGGPGDGPRRIEVETNPRHGFWRGAVGFARGPALVNASQWFVLVSARPELADQDFTCFGHVVSGMDAVDRLEQCDEILEVRVLRCGAPGIGHPQGAGEPPPDEEPQEGGEDPQDPKKAAEDEERE